ncbi:type III toxin-antitoxin system TenpIN family toxin [Stenotrophomonas muris]|uniref:type III toxin-antitoxin system TenpIN family toxin n=1 Tax=Stenotrophomonas muris TaxID=2963283 RepID=UPI0039C748AC
MLLLKLEALFFQENAHLVEVLDKNKSGEWDGEKERGYGIAVISHNGLRFGIPLRSHISHHYCYRTSDTKGLDYTKAVLLKKDTYISDRPFMIPSDEYVKIKDRSHHISNQFGKYVDKYVDGVKKADKHVLYGYRFSTLQNYHAELGVP